MAPAARAAAAAVRKMGCASVIVGVVRGQMEVVVVVVEVEVVNVDWRGVEWTKAMTLDGCGFDSWLDG